MADYQTYPTKLQINSKKPPDSIKKNKYLINFGLIHSFTVGTTLFIMLSFRVRNNRIKAMALIIYFGLAILLLNNCEDEKAQARSYPQVRTNPVSGITSNGATFNAEIYSLGTEQIINHGFVWDDNKYADLTDDKILLGPASVSGVYSAEIEASLAKDVEYTVKSFVQTAEHVVYGLPVTFKSLGSGAPVVTGFEPDSAAWMDTIRISGKNFSSVLSNNIVKISEVKCNVISLTDSTLVILVNTGFSDFSGNISVEVSGNRSEFTGYPFKLEMPVLADFVPSGAYWGDTLSLRGRHLKTLPYNSANYVKIGSVNCSFIKCSDTTASVIVHNEVDLLNSSLYMRINGINLTVSKKFDLLPPYFIFSPRNGTWLDIITMTGRFNSEASNNKIYFKNDTYISEVPQQLILSTTYRSITFKVPQDLTPIKTVLGYGSVPFGILSADSFRLYPPEIRSFSPSSGPTGTVINIKGKYFNSMDPIVYIGDVRAFVSSASDSVIQSVVPGGLSGSVKISVQAKSQGVIAAGLFSITNPVITLVSPLSATFGGLVTIDGQNLTSSLFPTKVFFSQIPAEIVSANVNKLVVRVPSSIDSIPRLIFVSIGEASVSSGDLFILTQPQITSITPSGLTLGGLITINGLYFNPDITGNKVYWNSYELPVISATNSVITASVPMSLPAGNTQIQVVSGGYRVYSSSSFEIKSPWISIPPNSADLGAGVNVNENMISFGIRGKGYLMGFNYPIMYRFTPGLNTFENIGYFQDFYRTMGLSSIISNDTVYLIDGSRGLYRFDIPSSSWIWLANDPSNDQGGISFSLNNKIYYGLVPGADMGKLWVYDPIYKNWIQKKEFPEQGEQVPVSFVINNKGYVLFYDKKLYSYDPVNDNWTRLSSYPGPGNLVYGRTAFTINSLGFVGGGKELYTEQAYNELWSYNPSTDTWKQEVPIPGRGRFNLISFTIDNKAYVGFGMTYTPGGWQIQASDFYEYDPNYPVK